MPAAGHPGHRREPTQAAAIRIRGRQADHTVEPAVAEPVDGAPELAGLVVAGDFAPGDADQHQEIVFGGI